MAAFLVFNLFFKERELFLLKSRANTNVITACYRRYNTGARVLVGAQGKVIFVSQVIDTGFNVESFQKFIAGRNIHYHVRWDFTHRGIIAVNGVACIGKA